VGGLVTELVAERTTALARDALFVEVAGARSCASTSTRPSSSARPGRCRWSPPRTAPDPPADPGLLLVVVDDLLADPRPDFGPERAIRAVLRGILAG
jgi:hypothetical protein